MSSRPLASRLEGKRLGRWTILKKKEKQPESSGHFSTCYKVRDDQGREGFLKSFNYLYAFSGNQSSADVMKFMVDNFTYERNLLQFCSANKMRRVVTAIDSGESTKNFALRMSQGINSPDILLSRTELLNSVPKFQAITSMDQGINTADKLSCTVIKSPERPS
jgi:hypothetical protein